MGDIFRLFQAFVAPAIFVSASALLALSLNVRLMGMVTRLRQFHRDRYVAAIAGRHREVEVVDDQIRSIERRAEKIRKSFLLVLVSLAGSVATCLLLGLGVYWAPANLLAVAVVVLAILSLLVGTIFYIAEIAVALMTVREEDEYFEFLETSRRPGQPEPSNPERRDGWQRAV